MFNNKIECGLQIEDSFHLINNWVDSLSGKHTNIYCQYYKNIPIENSDYTEIFDEHGVYLTTGWIIEGLNLSSSPAISESQALDVILNNLNAEKYAWTDSTLTDTCDLDSLYNQSDTICFETDYYPVGKLVYYNKFHDKNPNNFVLVWRFNSVLATKPLSDKKWYIDANSGQIIDSISNLQENTANHWYYGSVSIDTKWYGGLRNKFTLEANDNNKCIETRTFASTGANGILTLSNNNGWRYRNFIKNSSSSWGSDNRDETSTHHVVTSAWEFFASTFNHHGFSNNYKYDVTRVGVFLNGSTGYKSGSSTVLKDDISGVSYNLEYLVFSKLDGQLTCTYDHAGHEFAHIVNRHSKKLLFNDATEASSINEGFCDIFGFMTERYSKVTGWDWVVGGDLQTSKVRSMFSPLTTPFRSVFAPGNTNFPEFYPAIYKGSNWYFVTSGRNAEPHINSTVLSRCFNLLSVGGTQNGVSLNGIGVDKAGKIAWYAFRNLVDDEEDFKLLRQHMVVAATILFGNCSPEVFETCKAWKACGIGDLCPCSSGVKDIGNWIEDCRSPSELPNNKTQIKDYQFELKNIKIYPNPSDEIINLSFLDFGQIVKSNIRVLIIAMDSKILMENKYNSLDKDKIEIDISNLSSGVYQVCVETINGIYSYKFIKQ